MPSSMSVRSQPKLKNAVSPEIRELETQVISKKKEFNTLHSQTMQQEQLLERLEGEIRALDFQARTDSELSAIKLGKDEEASEILKGLENEKYYQQILQYMISRLKVTSNALDKPVSTLKLKLKELRRKKRDADELKLKLNNEVTLLRTDYRTKKRELEHGKMFIQKDLYSSLADLNEKEAAFEVLQTEHKLNNDHEQLKRNNKLLNQIEPMLKALEEEEMNLQNMQDLERNYKQNKEKFKVLKDATNIASIVDAKDYYKYLKETENILEQEKKDAQNKEKILSEELGRVVSELNKAKIKHSERNQTDNRVYEEMEKELAERNHDMNENEQILENLEMLVNTACCAVSRLSLQLLNQQEAMDCKPRNVLRQLEECTKEIIERYELASRYGGQMKEESINTSMKYMQSPDWLNLKPSRDSERKTGHSGHVEFIPNNLQVLRRPKNSMTVTPSLN